MGKKLRVICYISFILIFAYFVNIALKDDVKEIERTVRSLNQPLTKIVHIKVLDNTQAIVFYEHVSANIEYFGNVRLKKNLFGWKLGNSSSSQTPDNYKLGWQFSNLKYDFSEYTDLISGKILDSEIKDVIVVTKNKNEYHAEVIKYNNGQSFWYLITDGEELPGCTVSGISSEGKIIEQITM